LQGKYPQLADDIVRLTRAEFQSKSNS
jgi:hypothetical protein